MSEHNSSTSEEIFQESTTPVQAFTTPVVPATLATETRERLGRPPRVVAAKPRTAT